MYQDSLKILCKQVERLLHWNFEVPGNDRNEIPMLTRMHIFKYKSRGFSGGPMVRIWCFHCRGPGSIPGWGTKTPEATCSVAKKKTNKYKGINDSRTLKNSSSLRMVVKDSRCIFRRGGFVWWELPER